MRTAEQMIKDLQNGGGPLIGLSPQQLQRLVGQYAPFCEVTRDLFFAELRAYADKHIPCEVYE